MIDFTDETNGGGGSVSTALLSYPTGGETLTDTTLYNYIKGLYDSGISIIENDTNLTFTGTLPTISNSGVITHFDAQSLVYGEIPAIVNTPTNFVIKGAFIPKQELYQSIVMLATDNTTENNNNQVFLQLFNTPEHPYSFVLYWRTGAGTSGVGFSADNVWTVDSKVYFEIRYDGTTLKLSTGASADNLTERMSETTFIPTTFKYLFIGNKLLASEYRTSFDIELNVNEFSYIDNNAVYFSPRYYNISCKLATSGSKIVDVANEGIIADMYNNHGSTLYYTIDTTNKTVKLPRGDIFGFITQALSN